MREVIAKLIDNLHAAANHLKDTPLQEEEFADTLGEVRFAEVKLATFRRETLAEAPEYQEGDEYEITTTRPNGYSYNVQAIMSDLGGEGLGVMDLIKAGAVELDWKLTKLRNVLDAVGITTRIVGRELRADDMTSDGPHIGKYRKAAYTRVSGKPVQKESPTMKRAYPGVERNE